MGEGVIINGKTEIIKGLLASRCREGWEMEAQVVSKTVLQSGAFSLRGKVTTIALTGHSGAQ